MRVGNVLRLLGCERKRIMISGERKYVYFGRERLCLPHLLSMMTHQPLKVRHDQTPRGTGLIPTYPTYPT